jgi:esterase
VKLATQDFGQGGDRPPLLIAHGLFGSARNWGVIARRLAETRRVVTVDMRNHGDSPWAETHGYEEMAEDLAEVIEGQWDVLGHSMGGKAAMVLALSHPGKVNRLVVADIAPVAYGHTQAHLVDAMEGLGLSGVTTRGDADRALAAAVEDAGVRAFLLQSLDVRERRWRLNLDALRREMPKILSFPEIAGRFDGPALFLSGGTSSYVRPEHRARIKALLPEARFAKIPGAGHWLHAEKPREFEAAVSAFLS